MSRLLDIIRHLVRQELARQRTTLLGVVTAIFAHEAEDDEYNYEVNVKLKHEDLELLKVPVAVGHIGIVAPPRVNDLVLVHFVNGDLNQPVISGRFYHADDRPPLFHEDEILFEQRVPDGTLNHFRFMNDGTIYLQRDVTKPEDNSEAKTSFKIDGESGNIEVKMGEAQIQITAEMIKIVDSNENSIEMNKEAFNIHAKVPFTIDASGQPVIIKGDTIDFNKA
ncbi:hypothetical protein EH223_19300 [candidate division KSB1 bacterium]|nr:hypothetical protein [candidate division KSB1 bacterium]RQW00096.1 MAG: hypothetical protein EH223_19300 [candidate division KSB1 bacterium]